MRHPTTYSNQFTKEKNNSITFKTKQLFIESAVPNKLERKLRTYTVLTKHV
jgi:hypothetical protein